MKKLLLMRHAETNPENPASHDHDRPLSPQGRQAARLMGALLMDHDLVPGRLVSSTATRARETVAGLLEMLDSKKIESEYTRQLYLATPDTYTNLLRQLPDEIKLPILIGHNPGISNFLEISCRMHAHMPTAAIAEIHFDIQHWDSLEAYTLGALNNLWKPRA